MSVPKLYIDHSIVTHEASWQTVEDVLSAGKAQLVLSVWNLFEIGSATDRAQRAHRLAFLKKFNPLWILERVEIQRQEVQNYLFKEKLGVSAEDTQMIKRYLSEVELYQAGSKTRIGLTPEGWIDGVDFQRFEKEKDRAPTALRQLQAYGRKKFKERQEDIFQAWVRGLIPAIKPDGHAYSIDESKEMLEFCSKNQSAFYAACPAMRVEDSLTRARTASATRNPQRSDGIDLMHAVVALSYCDYFLVRDGFVSQCCERVRKELTGEKLATVYRDADELKKALA